MSSDIWIVLGGAFLGLWTVFAWSMELFSDSFFGQFFRSYSSTLKVRSVSCIGAPAFGISSLLLSTWYLVERVMNIKLSLGLRGGFAIIGLVFMLVFMVSWFIPERWVPKWLSPEWHLARRQVRARERGEVAPEDVRSMWAYPTAVQLWRGRYERRATREEAQRKARAEWLARQQSDANVGASPAADLVEKQHPEQRS